LTIFRFFNALTHVIATTMPRLPSAGAMALYQQRSDWTAFEQLSPSDDKKKLLNVIHVTTAIQTLDGADIGHAIHSMHIQLCHIP